MKRLVLTTSIAVIILAGCSTGAPSASPSSAGEIGGVVTFQGDSPTTTEVDAVADGTSVSGTAVTTSSSGTHTVRLACAARDGDTWVLAGTVEESTVESGSVGAWSAVVVRDGSPQQIGIWYSDDPSTASDCEAWVASIEPSTLVADLFRPVESGTLVPPPFIAP